MRYDLVMHEDGLHRLTTNYIAVINQAALIAEK